MKSISNFKLDIEFFYKVSYFSDFWSKNIDELIYDYFNHRGGYLVNYGFNAEEVNSLIKPVDFSTGHWGSVSVELLQTEKEFFGLHKYKTAQLVFKKRIKYVMFR